MPETTPSRPTGPILAILAIAALLVGGAIWLGQPKNSDEPPIRVDDRPPAAWDTTTREYVRKSHHAIEHYIISGKSEQAAYIVERHVKAFPKDPTGHYLLAKLRFVQQKPDEAFASFERAISLDNLADDVAFEAASFAPDAERALELYIKAVELRPRDARYRMHLGAYLMKIGRDADAATQLNIARDLNPALPPVHAMLSELDARAGKFDAALQSINRSLEYTEAGSKKRLAYTLIKAQILRRAGRPDAGLDTLRRIPDDQINHPKVIEGRALCYADLKQYGRSAIEWMSLVDEDPKDIRYVTETAWAFYRAGDRDNAHRYLLVGQQLAPDHPQIIELTVAMAKKSG